MHSPPGRPAELDSLQGAPGDVIAASSTLLRGKKVGEIHDDQKIFKVVVWGNLPGHEIEYPMAFVIMGGLATPTVLNLLVMPALFARWGRTSPAPVQ
jgi:hypothetical protein